MTIELTMLGVDDRVRAGVHDDVGWWASDGHCCCLFGSVIIPDAVAATIDSSSSRDALASLLANELVPPYFHLE